MKATAREMNVMEIAAEALEQPPLERNAFLEEACRLNAALRSEVNSLLQFERSAQGFIARSAAEAYPEAVLASPSVAGARSFQQGQTLGRFQILSLLGEGGMGEVYLAEDPELRRLVAIKLVKRGLGSEALLRHFEQEKRILAGLNDPHIARLYGAALTDDGRSYLVMEYVEGERLDSYCRNQRLALTERLRLFRKVCAAVSHAHQHLVVHRDLKPANVRVTPQGEPKLLDFGIAKLLEPEAPVHSTNATVTLPWAMTPEYASPEQLRGEAITTASDVYSLGVILYELLTGQKPHAGKSLRPDELARAICEVEPARPSTIVARRPDARNLVNTSQESPVWLRRHLEGDLDNIVTMALRKDPARRYSSVGQFSEDIRRHQDGLPVLARCDTWSYRSGKFVRRNKVGVLAAALVALALVTGLVAMTWQANVVREERDHSRIAQRQAERLNGFLQTLLGSANPDKGPGRNLKVVDVLDQAAKKLDAELAGEPAILAQAHLTVGQAYTGLRLADQAYTHLREAVRIDRALYGDDHLVTARAKTALAVALPSGLPPTKWTRRAQRLGC